MDNVPRIQILVTTIFMLSKFREKQETGDIKPETGVIFCQRNRLLSSSWSESLQILFSFQYFLCPNKLQSAFQLNMNGHLDPFLVSVWDDFSYSDGYKDLQSVTSFKYEELKTPHFTKFYCLC